MLEDGELSVSGASLQGFALQDTVVGSAQIAQEVPLEEEEAALMSP